MIPLDPLIVAAIILITVGIFYTLISSKTGIVLVGLGTVIAGVFLFTIVPNGLHPLSIFFNGLLTISGVWMVVIGAKREGAQR